MKFVRNVLFFSMLIALQCCTSITLTYVAQSTIEQSTIAQSTIAKKSPVSKASLKKTMSLPAQNHALPSNIPYMKELQAAHFPIVKKQSLITAWQNVYQVFQAKNSATPPAALTHAQANAVAPLFTTNFLTQMHTYFASKQNFATLPDDANNLKKQYATFHMANACARLASLHSISFENNTPHVQFSGDMRDQGIIVNIKNNTNTKFVVSQNSLDGKTKTHIGVINPGLNGVNLHTAALQSPNTKQSSTTQAQSVYSFNFQELGAENPTSIAIKMYTGTELITFLETLPRKQKDVFSMNGLPTSKEYLTNPDDWYMVLIQNPTSKNQPEPNLDQRIQAINISKLTGPYLLSIQINAEIVQISAEQTGQTPTTLDLFQPSLTDALIPRNQYLPMQNFPIIILSKYLEDIPQLQTLWMLHTTSYIATLSDYKFLGLNSFGNMFEYFEKMGFFNMGNKFTFFIDLFNSFPISYALYNAQRLITTAVFETQLSNSSDIPQIYTAQDSYGHVTVNGNTYNYTTFQTEFISESDQTTTAILYNQVGFNTIYALPHYNLHTLITNALQTDIKENIFGALTKIQSNIYQLTWTNKKNKVIDSQYLYTDSSIVNIKISFINEASNWIGNSIPTDLIPTEKGTTTHFKVTYELSTINNKHILLIQPISPLDKINIIPFQFSTYPLNELYIDTYHTYNVQPYTRGYIIKNGILPAPLLPLTEQDWELGIYVIPVVHHNDQISKTNSGKFTVFFYKSDYTPLGNITLNEETDNPNETTITKPIHAYNLHYSALNGLKYLYLTTGVLLQYVNQN